LGKCGNIQANRVLLHSYIPEIVVQIEMAQTEHKISCLKQCVSWGLED